MTPTIRPLADANDYRACVALQRETWGADFTECVPPAMLMIAAKMGGVVTGAFDDDGRMLGFLYGVTGWRDGGPYHWSHMLAVSEDARDAGIGSRLKADQRERLLAIGVTEVRWSFDPLVARNAHVNLNRLGARVESYVEDMYASEEHSRTDSVIGSDRFIAVWDLDRSWSPLEAPAEGHLRLDVGDDGGPRESPADAIAPDLPVGVAVPSDIQTLKLAAPDVAVLWRRETRRILQEYLAAGFRVGGFTRRAGDGGGTYWLFPPPT